MTATLSQAQQYARLKGTKVIAHRTVGNGDAISFVLESGHKYLMTGEELNAEINRMEKARAERDGELNGEETAAKPKGKGKAKPAAGEETAAG